MIYIKSRSGFLLLEFVLALALSLILFVHLSTIVLGTYKSYQRIKTKTKTFISSHAAALKCIHILSKAPASNLLWKKTSVSHMIWHDFVSDHGLYFYNNKLLYYSGVFQNDEWKKKTRSVILDNVQSCRFVYHHDEKSDTREETMRSVECHCQTTKEKLIFAGNCNNYRVYTLQRTGRKKI